MKKDLIQLTNWERSKEKFYTQYGYMAYHEWLEREEERILTDRMRCTEIRYHGNYCALFVNDICIHD